MFGWIETESGGLRGMDVKLYILKSGSKLNIFPSTPSSFFSVGGLIYGGRKET